MTQDERVLAIGAAFGPILKAAFPNASAFERMAVTDALATEVEKRTGWFAQEPVSKGGWQSIKSAPRDGSWFIADGGGLDRPTPMKWCERVGAWEADAVMLEDWDNQAEGYSRPLFWFAIPDRSTTPSKGLDAATVERAVADAKEFAEDARVNGFDAADALDLIEQFAALAIDPHQHGGKGA